MAPPVGATHLVQGPLVAAEMDMRLSQAAFGADSYARSVSIWYQG